MSSINKIVFVFIMLAILLFTPFIQYDEKESDHVTVVQSQCVFDWAYENYICPTFIDIN
jgi:hypothetical protein